MTLLTRSWTAFCAALGHTPRVDKWSRCCCHDGGPSLLKEDFGASRASGTPDTTGSPPSSSPRSSAACSCCSPLAGMYRQEAHALGHLRAHRLLVSKAVAEDFANMAEEIAAEAEDAADRHDFAMLYALTRRLRSGHDRPHKAVLSKGGVLLTDDVAVENRWTEHWCDHLAGEVVHFAELRSRNARPPPADDAPRLEPVALDTIEHMIQHSSTRKATGLDGVGAAVWKAGGEPAAVCMQQIINTSRHHVRAPLLAKGGRMQEVWKRKGLRADTKNSRGILVQSHVGKIHGGLLKSELEPSYATAVSETQCGAVKGRGTATAGLAAALHADLCRSKGLNFSQLYVDLTAAFDTVCREFAMMDETMTAADAAARLQGLGFSAAVVAKAQEVLERDGNLLRKAGASQALSEMVADLHENTWIKVATDAVTDDTSLVCTTKGARQGCKIGALIFNVIYECALALARGRARAQGLLQQLEIVAGACPWEVDDDAVPLPADLSFGPFSSDVADLAYVDDVDWMLSAECPYELIKRTRHMLQIVLRSFRECGLECNLAPGKTEVALFLQGKGSRKAKAPLYVPSKKCYMLPTPDGAHSILVTAKYKYLGSIAHRSGSATHDAKAKVSSALEAYYPLANRVFGNSSIKLQTRLSLVTSLCFSKLFFGLDTWLDPSPAAAHTIHGARLRILRRVAQRSRFASTGHGTDTAVLADLKQLPTDLVLLQTRLVTAAKTLMSGPSLLRALRLQPGTGAARALATDLQWAWSAAPALRHFPDPKRCPGPWLSLMASPHVFKRALHTMRAEHTRMVPRTSPPRFYDARSSPPPCDAPWVCPQCPAKRRRCCTTSGGLLSHRCRSHGYHNPVREFIAGPRCPVCLKVFRTRALAIDHACHRATHCRDSILAGSVPRLPRDTLTELDLLDRQAAAALPGKWTDLRSH